MTEENLRIVLILLPVVTIPLSFLLVRKTEVGKTILYVLLVGLLINYVYQVIDFQANNTSGWPKPKSAFDFAGDLDMLRLFVRGVMPTICFALFLGLYRIFLLIRKKKPEA